MSSWAWKAKASSRSSSGAGVRRLTRNTETERVPGWQAASSWVVSTGRTETATTRPPEAGTACSIGCVVCSGASTRTTSSRGVRSHTNGPGSPLGRAGGIVAPADDDLELLRFGRYQQAGAHRGGQIAHTGCGGFRGDGVLQPARVARFVEFVGPLRVDLLLGSASRGTRNPVRYQVDGRCGRISSASPRPSSGPTRSSRSASTSWSRTSTDSIRTLPRKRSDSDCSNNPRQAGCVFWLALRPYHLCG